MIVQKKKPEIIDLDSSQAECIPHIVYGAREYVACSRKMVTMQKNLRKHFMTLPYFLAIKLGQYLSK